MGTASLVAAGAMAAMAALELGRMFRRPQAERLEVVLVLAVLAFAAAGSGTWPDLHAVALAASAGLLARAGRRLRAQPRLLAWPLLLLGLGAGALAYLEPYRAPAHAAAAVVALAVAVAALLSKSGRARVVALGTLAVAAWNGLEAAALQGHPVAGGADWAALAAALLLAPALAPPQRLRRLLAAERLQEAARSLALLSRSSDQLLGALGGAARIAVGSDRAGVFLPGSGEGAAWAIQRTSLGPAAVKARDVPRHVRRHCPGAHLRGVALAPIGPVGDPHGVFWGVPDAAVGSLSDAADILDRLAEQAAPLIEQAALLEQQAGEAVEARGQVEHKARLLGALAHELGNPLSPIQLQLNVLERRGDDPAARAKTIAVIARNVARISALLDEMRTAAQVEEGRLVLDRRPVPLRPLVEHAVEAHADLARKQGCRLQVRRLDDVQVLADPVRLGQVLDNLVNNAIKYSPGGGTVSIDCIQEHGRVLIAVQDEGLGLDQAQQEQVLGAYERVHTGEHPGIKGTGLGLAIVQGIIEGHGGELRVYSPGRGQGSTFSFRIPAKAQGAFE